MSAGSLDEERPCSPNCGLCNPGPVEPTLDEAWAAVLDVLPANYGMSVAADGPGYVARASGPLEIVYATWSVDDPELVPDPDHPATPAKALLKLARFLKEDPS